MKIRRFGVAVSALALMALFVAGSSQAVDVVKDGSNCIKINELNVMGTLYTVDFALVDAESIHGPFPGVYRFDEKAEATEAVEAVNAVLNQEDCAGVTDQGSELYKLAFDSWTPFDVPMALVKLNVTEGGVDWIDQDDTNFQVYTDETVYALFTPSGATTTTVAVTTTTGSGTTTTGTGTTTTAGATTTTVVTMTGCADAPIEGCFKAGKGSLKVNEKKLGKEKVNVKVEKLDGATTQADFGNPLNFGGTAYEICIWDADGFVESLLVDQAGQACGKKSKECWKDKSNGKGWQYKDDLAASDGVKKIAAKSGDAGKGKVQADAANKSNKGQTAMPTGIAAAMQGATGALVQVATSDAACFEAVLTDVKKNDGVKFEAKVAKDNGGGEDPGSLCNEAQCATNDAQAQKCEDFVDLCLTVEMVNEEECAGGAILICEGGPPPDVNPGNVCSQNLCENDMELADACQEFLDLCLAEEPGANDEECLGAAYFICRPEETL